MALRSPDVICQTWTPQGPSGADATGAVSSNSNSPTWSPARGAVRFIAPPFTSGRASYANFFVAPLVAEFCYHSATNPPRSRVIYSHHHSVVIVGIAYAWVVLGLRGL